jgi:hypothetical protein
VAAAREGSAESESLLRQAALGARKAGHTWEAIGHVLGVSRQAAQQRFAASGEDANAFVGDRDRQHVVNGANLFNEMQILEREGRAGWRLVGVGCSSFVSSPPTRPGSTSVEWTRAQPIDGPCWKPGGGTRRQLPDVNLASLKGGASSR